MSNLKLDASPSSDDRDLHEEDDDMFEEQNGASLKATIEQFGTKMSSPKMIPKPKKGATVVDDRPIMSKRPPLRRSKSEYISHTEELRAGHTLHLATSPVSPTSPISRYGKHFAVALGKRTLDTATPHTTPHVLAMVGLPARGKTYISKKLSRYLNWIGVETKVFNLGDYRRKYSNYIDNSIFDPNNKDAVNFRTKICNDALNDAFDWLDEEGGEVAVVDATNTTRERRRLLYERVVKEKGFKLFFIESVCDDNEIIKQNIKGCKVTSPDYVGKSEDEVLKDFLKRIKHYEDLYETLDEDLEPDLSFLKIFNAGRKTLVHKHEGHIQSRVVYYLMNIKITPRTIYLTRHGESVFNTKTKIGGDSDLSSRGQEYGKVLSEYVNSLNIPNLRVWTSWMKRTIQTAKNIKGVHERWKTLNEIEVGICDGMTYEEIKRQYPEEFVARDKDKYKYRYPRGESYEDLVGRLEPVIMELERQGSVIVVGHQAVLRCILAYFQEIDEDDLPYIEVPMHTVLTLEPRAYGCHVVANKLNVACVDTHRPKPKVPGFLEEKFRTSAVIE